MIKKQEKDSAGTGGKPDRPLNRWSEWLQAFTAGIAVVLSVSSLVRGPESFDWLTSRVSNDQARTRHELAGIREELKHLKLQLDAVAKSPARTGVTVELEDVSRAEKSLERKMQSIEEIILKDPAEALAIPMLRKDIERIQELNQAQLAALTADLERTYSLVIATLIALAVAVLTPALTNLLARRRERITATNEHVAQPPNPGPQADV
jgi:hypothetical protein